MKLKFLLTSLLFSQAIGAQSFIEVSPSPFEGVDLGSIAFADVDNDGDQDLVISGATGSVSITKLYTNDGNGHFTENIDTSFEGLDSGSIAFADIDNDEDQDLVISGFNDSVAITKLYTNDGNGHFTENINTSFEGVDNSSIAFADVDNDGDQDLVISGLTGSVAITKLYTNDGNGHFTENIDTSFEGVYYNSIAFADVDNDGDQDLVISGFTGSVAITKLYTNDGNGHFTENIDTSFEGVYYNSIAFADVDNDGDQDLVISGFTGSVAITKLYTNDGNGHFTENIDTSFEDVDNSSIAFADVDNDGDQDLVISGFTIGFETITKLYTNDGNGHFTENIDTSFEGVDSGSIAFADVDNDGDQDLVISGLNNGFEVITKLYLNDFMVSTKQPLNSEISLSFSSFPNPTTASMLYMHYTASEITEATIKIYNTNGLLLQQQSELVHEGQQVFTINIKDLHPGTFLVELELGGKRGIATFVVQ